MMENTHTSHSCLQSHQNFRIGLSFNKTLHFLIVEPFGFQKKVQAWMKHQSGKTPMLATLIALMEKTIVLIVVLQK
jgi:hypothetical protein